MRWFILDSHGILNARPRPRCGVFAPVLTSGGLAAFGRDQDSAKQVWSRDAGYPGDPRYRDFYRDVGFDLDLDYVNPHLPAPGLRGFTGIKYHRITGPAPQKAVYDRPSAVRAAEEHASHFWEARAAQIRQAARLLDRPPLVVSPYDAELFGHWWYEGPEFLDCFVRKACAASGVFTIITPTDYLRLQPVNQVAAPSPSSWGEEGYWRVWLNEKNQWIYPHVRAAQARLTALVRRLPQPDPLTGRALKQAARELLLAQASDWPFLLNNGTSPDYARRRVKDHLLRFNALCDQLDAARVDEPWLTEIESRDNIFPDLDCRYWT